MATNARERASLIARRPWTSAERSVVLRGVIGRLAIAIEPIIVFSVFAGLSLAFVILRRPDAFVWAPLFGFAALVFAAYAVVLMVAPIRALMQTFSPIYVVDGYVRYRSTDLVSDPNAYGYVAVLDEHRRQLCEWQILERSPVDDRTIAAMVEFTNYGGIHRIDGKPTGVLPPSLPVLGVRRPAPPAPPR